MKTLEQNTNSNPEWLIKLNNLSSKEILFQEAIGVNDKIIDFLLEAFSESKLNIFKNYLTEQEFSFMKQHYAKEMKSWPQLLVDLDKAIKLGIEPDSKHAKNLASKWIKMFQGYAGKDPNTHEKIRKAMHNEKSLAEGTWLKPEALMFLEKQYLHYIINKRGCLVLKIALMRSDGDKRDILDTKLAHLT